VLERLLNLLGTGGLYTPGQLAERLGVSEGLVEMMLADLSRMGYLRPLPGGTCQTPSGGRSSPCGHCALAGACTVSGPGGRVWALTELLPPAQAVPRGDPSLLRDHNAPAS
jgi:hypothetical protein